MPIFNHLSQDDFINDYWQKKSLVFTQPFSNLNSIVDGNELAGLACDHAVEARIISGHDLNSPWTCQHGPFNEKTFAALGDRDWTLLIQGIDQWDDQISAILNNFDFLPTWRLEDIMASYAPIGGSVGPHFDYYDVFLIQITGSREWQIGQQCDDATDLQDNDEVKLISQFDCQSTHTLNAGDMIYIPAGIAHWGKSLSDDCITFSVGFRAPSDKEIIVEALEDLIEHFESSDDEDKRYQDTPESIDGHTNKINHSCQKQLASALKKLTPELLNDSINKAFGKLVTDPRHNPFDDEAEKIWTKTELVNAFNNETSLPIRHSSNSRFAFSDTQLFVNGEAFTIDEKFSQAVCDQQILKPSSQQQIEILLSLLNQHYISL